MYKNRYLYLEIKCHVKSVAHKALKHFSREYWTVRTHLKIGHITLDMCLLVHMVLYVCRVCSIIKYVLSVYSQSHVP